MIKEFVARFMDGREKLEAGFRERHPADYAEIVKRVVEVVRGDATYGAPDPERIHVIDDGNYQGTLLFIIPEETYQPSDYWYVKVSYGSCSGCDTLEGIRSYDDSLPNDTQVKDYMTLALHIVQGLKKMGDEYWSSETIDTFTLPAEEVSPSTLTEPPKTGFRENET